MENKKYIYAVQYRVESPYSVENGEYLYIHETDERIVSNGCICKLELKLGEILGLDGNLSITSINLL